MARSGDKREGAPNKAQATDSLPGRHLAGEEALSLKKLVYFTTLVETGSFSCPQIHHDGGRASGRGKPLSDWQSIRVRATNRGFGFDCRSGSIPDGDGQPAAWHARACRTPLRGGRHYAQRGVRD